MRALLFGAGAGIAWAAVQGYRNGDSGVGALVVLFVLLVLLSFFLGRRTSATATATATAVASAEAQSTSQAAAQGGSVVLNVYSPTSTDQALGWGYGPGTVPVQAELSVDEILELAPDDDFSDVLDTYYGEGPQGLLERVEEPEEQR